MEYKVTVDMRTLSDSELYLDLLESQQDILICWLCLEIGATRKNTIGEIKYRIHVNEKIAAAIEQEMRRRKEEEKIKDYFTRSTFGINFTES